MIFVASYKVWNKPQWLVNQFPQSCVPLGTRQHHNGYNPIGKCLIPKGILNPSTLYSSHCLRCRLMAGYYI